MDTLELLEISKLYPNGYDLGEKYRLRSMSNSELDDFCLLYPNDYDLGRFIRSSINV